MSDADIEEITSKIAQLGETVKQAKTEKKPKEEWEPALQEMLALKVRHPSSLGFWDGTASYVHFLPELCLWLLLLH